jgi:hypothetical protein
MPEHAILAPEHDKLRSIEQLAVSATVPSALIALGVVRRLQPARTSCPFGVRILHRGPYLKTTSSSHPRLSVPMSYPEGVDRRKCQVNYLIPLAPRAGEQRFNGTNALCWLTGAIARFDAKSAFPHWLTLRLARLLSWPGRLAERANDSRRETPVCSGESWNASTLSTAHESMMLAWPTTEPTSIGTAPRKSAPAPRA